MLETALIFLNNAFPCFALESYPSIHPFSSVHPGQVVEAGAQAEKSRPPSRWPTPPAWPREHQVVPLERYNIIYIYVCVSMYV